MEELQNKEVCPFCKQVHDKDLDNLTELAEILASSFTDEAFPLIWKDAKEDIKEMKKRQIAEEMFYMGSVQMLTSFLTAMHDIPELMDKKKKE